MAASSTNHASPAKYFFVQALTLGRIPLILIFLAVSLWDVDTRSHAWWFNVAFYSMILSAVTDLFDGYFARKFNVVSRLGAYADPLCDKFFYLTVFPTLIYISAHHQNLQADPVPAFHTRLVLALTIFYLMRDQWISFLRSIGSIYGVDASAHMAGKIRTFVSFPVICMIYYYLQAPRHWPLQLHRPGSPPYFVYALEWGLLILNLHSIWYYTRFYWPWIRKEMRPEDQPPQS